VCGVVIGALRVADLSRRNIELGRGWAWQSLRTVVKRVGFRRPERGPCFPGRGNHRPEPTNIIGASIRLQGLANVGSGVRHSATILDEGNKPSLRSHSRTTVRPEKSDSVDVVARIRELVPWVKTQELAGRAVIEMWHWQIRRVEAQSARIGLSGRQAAGPCRRRVKVTAAEHGQSSYRVSPLPAFTQTLSVSL